MAEYIDREVFIEDLKTEITNLRMDGLKGTRMPHDELYGFIERINAQPAADVVPVVRCKECAYQIDGHCENENMNQGMTPTWISVEPDWYCCHGAQNTRANRMAARLKARFPV